LKPTKEKIEGKEPQTGRKQFLRTAGGQGERKESSESVHGVGRRRAGMRKRGKKVLASSREEKKDLFLLGKERGYRPSIESNGDSVLGERRRTVIKGARPLQKKTKTGGKKPRAFRVAGERERRKIPFLIIHT